jgi:signal transduction histidine kinase
MRDLMSPLDARGIEAELSVTGVEHIDQAQEALVYRAAQEALRNVVDHAQATRASATVTGAPGVTRLAIVDDGSGFTQEQREQRLGEGHLGLSLLEELARQSGAELTVRSAPRQGTTVELEVPKQ